MARTHAKTVVIADRPRVSDADLHALASAEDGAIVTIQAKVFLACAPLGDSQAVLSKADRKFWTEVGQRRGKLRAPAAFAAVGVIAGVPYILDGAKRARAWRDGLLRAPQDIHVTVHQLVSLKQAEKIAAAYRSSQTIERSADTIKAAYAALDMRMASHRLAHGTIASAIYLAFRGALYREDEHPARAPIDLAKAIGLIKDELLFLDRSGCPSRIFFSGILAMAIIATAVDPDAKDFIRQIADKRGNKVDGKMDPAESVLHLALITELMEPGRAAEYQEELFSRALRAFDKWRNAKKKPARAYTKGLLTAIDPAPFVDQFRSSKGIKDRADL